MNFIETIKRFFDFDEEEYMPQNRYELERELADARHTAKEYKKLALLKNQECVGKAKLIKELNRRIEYLEKVNRCQAELLAERKV